MKTRVMSVKNRAAFSFAFFGRFGGTQPVITRNGKSQNIDKIIVFISSSSSSSMAATVAVACSR